jgi:replicative superfamily II helicase
MEDTCHMILKIYVSCHMLPQLFCKTTSAALHCCPVGSALTQACVYREGGNMGAANLYEWQAEALMQSGVMDGRNLVYCAPTSGGKSLVAEILALKRLYATGKAALLVLPFVSLCSEKAAHWEKILEPLGYRVRILVSYCMASQK